MVSFSSFSFSFCFCFCLCLCFSLLSCCSPGMQSFVQQEIKSNRLASGKGIVELTKPSKSLSTMINDAMVRSEAEHVKQWQRYKHFNNMKRTHSSGDTSRTKRKHKRHSPMGSSSNSINQRSRSRSSGGSPKGSPMKLLKLKKHTGTGVLQMSPLGYDGALPAVKKSMWTRNGPRLTSSSKYATKEFRRTPVTAPRRHLWNGLRVQNTDTFFDMK